MGAVTPPPPDEALVAETVGRLPSAGRFLKLLPLAGDASNRRYFRVETEGGQTLVLMQLASPEAFKQSEEAVSGPLAITELPFINVGRHLTAAGVPVPALHHYDETAGLLYLHDFGDLTLADAARGAPPAARRALYRTAIEILVRIHTTATLPPNPACVAFTRAFEAPLLMWEFEHFLEYGVVARQGTMKPEDARVVRAEFEWIAQVMAREQQVFTHRDYHSRNLMVHGEARDQIGVIDFQDALRGPAVYDLASLLRDAYIAIDETLIDELIVYYLEGVAAAGGPRAEAGSVRRLFDLTSIQRNLKAAGRFVYIDRVKGNPKFLSDIPRVLGYVRRNLDKYPELHLLRTHLMPYVPELQ